MKLDAGLEVFAFLGIIVTSIHWGGYHGCLQSQWDPRGN